MSYKDIKIQKTTYQKLAALGRYGDTMDSIISRVIEVAKRNDKEGALACK